MTEYTPDEVLMLIQALKKVRVKERSKKEKLEKTIKYLDQRRKFFNPTRDILSYIISHVENTLPDQALVAKMKEDMLTKK